MDRREFLAFLAAGGLVTAEGLWLPGKLISIPKRFDSKLDYWLSSGGIDVYHGVIYTEHRVENDVEIYRGDDVHIKALAHLEFDRIEVGNPYDIGPERVNVEHGDWSIPKGSDLRICWENGGILQIS